MRDTPQPWIIGAEGIVSPSVPFEKSHFGTWRRHHPRDAHQAMLDRLEYQGELVCEGASFDDMVTIVHAVRSVTVLRETLFAILQVSTQPEVREAATSALLFMDSMRHAICEEGRANRHFGEVISAMRYTPSAIYGYLPATASAWQPTPDPPPYLPLRYVTDNIEQAYEARLWQDIPF